MSRELEMYDVLKRHFERKDYFVIVDQFSLLSPEITSDRVDVVAAKWSKELLLDVIAVECKLEENAKTSVASGLGQAVDYQICLPQVYIATQRGEIGHLKTFLEYNGIGHFAIDLSSKEVTEEIRTRKGIVYNDLLFKHRTKDRLILVLVFLDLFGKDFRWGEMDTHGWAAKDFGNHVQLNAVYGHPSGDVFSGLNLERKQGFRNIYDRIGTVEFHRFLRSLPDDYSLDVWIDLWPPGDSEDMFPEKQANKVTMGDLNRVTSQIKTTLMRKKATERPHLQIRYNIWNNEQYLSKEAYTNKIKNTFDQLRIIFDYLK